MTNKVNGFDNLSLDVASKYSHINKAIDNIGKHCNYFLFNIAESLEQTIKQFNSKQSEKKLKKYGGRILKIELECNYEDIKVDEKYICINLYADKDYILSFSYGFGIEFESILASNNYIRSNESLHHYVEIYLNLKHYFKRTKKKTIMKEFWKNEIKDNLEEDYAIAKYDYHSYYPLIEIVDKSYDLDKIKATIGTMIQSEILHDECLDWFLVDLEKQAESYYSA